MAEAREVAFTSLSEASDFCENMDLVLGYPRQGARVDGRPLGPTEGITEHWAEPEPDAIDPFDPGFVATGWTVTVTGQEETTVVDGSALSLADRLEVKAHLTRARKTVPKWDGTVPVLVER